MTTVDAMQSGAGGPRGGVKRYALTVRRFWSAAVSAEMEYRANFFLAPLNSLLGLGGAVFTLVALYGTGYEMGGWSWLEALLVVAIYTVLDGLQ